MHFNCAGLHKLWVAVMASGLRHFTRKCSHKVARRKCPNASRLRLRHLPDNSRITYLCDMYVHAHFACAGSHKTCGYCLGCGIYLNNFRIKIVVVTFPCAFWLRSVAQNVQLRSGARHFSGKLSRQIALVRCPSASRLRRLLA